MLVTTATQCTAAAAIADHSDVSIRTAIVLIGGVLPMLDDIAAVRSTLVELLPLAAVDAALDALIGEPVAIAC